MRVLNPVMMSSPRMTCLTIRRSVTRPHRATCETVWKVRLDEWNTVHVRHVCFQTRPVCPLIQPWRPPRTRRAWSSLCDTPRVWWGRTSSQPEKYDVDATLSSVSDLHVSLCVTIHLCYFHPQISVKLTKVLLHMEDKYSICGFRCLRQATMVALAVTDCLPVWSLASVLAVCLLSPVFVSVAT